MSGQYKLKKCPNCHKEHRKRGLFCGQSCANQARPVTDNMRNKMRQVAIEYNRTPEAIAKQKQLNTNLASMTVEDFAVNIPELPPDIDYGSDWSDYDRASDW